MMSTDTGSHVDNPRRTAIIIVRAYFSGLKADILHPVAGERMPGPETGPQEDTDRTPAPIRLIQRAN